MLQYRTTSLSASLFIFDWYEMWRKNVCVLSKCILPIGMVKQDWERDRDSERKHPNNVISTYSSFARATLQQFWLFLTCQMVSPFRLMCYDENDKWFCYGFFHIVFFSLFCSVLLVPCSFCCCYCFMHEFEKPAAKIPEVKDGNGNGDDRWEREKKKERTKK